jgi:hypothetical protein
MNIHVCDLSDHVGLASSQILAQQGEQHILNMYGSSNGVGDAVAQIINEAGTYGTIDELDFWGHGGPGSMGISRGTESARNADWAGISVENFDDIKDTLDQLTNYFDQNAVVELHGCNVAKGANGQALLTELANLWGVRVRAGSATQHTPDIGWCGTVYEGSPGVCGTSSFPGPVQSPDE